MSAVLKRTVQEAWVFVSCAGLWQFSLICGHSVTIFGVFFSSSSFFGMNKEKER